MATRVLVCKLGLDGHDRGARLVSRELRDRGAEVIYLGIGTSAPAAAATAVDEDVDIVAVSLLSGAHTRLVADLVQELRERGSGVPVVCGGLIPEADREPLLAAGVEDVFSIGTSVAQAAEALLRVAQQPSDGGLD